MDVVCDIQRLTDDMVALRRDLHKHPELPFEEIRTAGIITSHLSEAGIQVKTGVGKTGVVGLIEGGVPGPTVMIRADMDALPVQEVAGREYGSVYTGRMHACGHDGHVAVLVTVARVLASHRGSLKGNVKLVFQPAEEPIAGALLMLEEGVMENPRVDNVLSFHLWSPLEVGTIGIRTGPIFSSTDILRIVVRGKGGHGGLPHQAIDPVVIAAQVVVAMQTIVSREVASGQRAVLTFGKITGGTQFNIIPDEVELGGNLRTLNDEVRSHVLARIEEMAKAIASGMRGQAVYEFVRGVPPVVNDPSVTKVVSDVAKRAVGTDRVLVVEPVSVGDDAAWFLQKAPGCYFLVGAGNKTRGIVAPHHNPSFDIDEMALPIAARILTETALHYLSG
jgi:amidohydrolase